MDLGNFVKRNEDAFTGDAFAVILGVLGRWGLKKQIIPSSSVSQVLTSFIVISAAGIGANELKSKYPIGG